MSPFFLLVANRTDKKGDDSDHDHCQANLLHSRDVRMGASGNGNSSGRAAVGALYCAHTDSLSAFLAFRQCHAFKSNCVLSAQSSGNWDNPPVSGHRGL